MSQTSGAIRVLEAAPPRRISRVPGGQTRFQVGRAWRVRLPYVQLQIKPGALLTSRDVPPAQAGIPVQQQLSERVSPVNISTRFKGPRMRFLQ